ncbi:unnamed protein product [Discosporangium mesarthrocarpum]
MATWGYTGRKKRWGVFIGACLLQRSPIAWFVRGGPKSGLRIPKSATMNWITDCFVSPYRITPFHWLVQGTNLICLCFTMVCGESSCNLCVWGFVAWAHLDLAPTPE